MNHKTTDQNNNNLQTDAFDISRLVGWKTVHCGVYDVIGKNCYIVIIQ